MRWLSISDLLENLLTWKNWYYKRGSETSDTDDERDESFDCNDQNSSLRHIREDQFINTQKKLQQESKFNQERKRLSFLS